MQFSAHNEQNLPLEKFESMLKTNDVYFFDTEDFEDIIHHYLNNGKISLAKKAINIGLEQHPTSSELKLLKVEVMVFENRLDDAEQLLSEIASIEITNEEVYIQKANIYSKKEDHSSAIEMLKLALSYTDDGSDIYSLLGMEYLFLDNYVLAKDNFIKCIEQDPEDYPALYNAIYCFDNLEDTQGAIDFLNKYLDKNPYCEVAWHQIGKQFFTEKRYKEAIAAFDFAIYSDDTFIGAYIEKGKVLEKIKRYNEAIENYEVTLQLEDPTSFALLRIGKCHEKLGNLDLAKEYFYKTVHEDPLLDKGWIAITDFYVRQDNYRKALYYINKAINIDTENVHYWKRSAFIHLKLHFYEEADLAYKKTVELGNYELDTWTAWTDVLIKLGEYNSAIQCLKQALEFYPSEAVLEYRLSAIYYMLGDAIEGSQHLKVALKTGYRHLKNMTESFPSVFSRNTVKNIITNFQKASN
ncbi:tetratricopeptide repeat protein [Zhouia spongiae]|uniref:Tetratricopeptide repeat protein n=1 Tax=Zhouia spongiae TaxID=2202721 RepID=A0ABY3YJ54_9FLAO|nr:tetratricopeptide repeat protein [Zhouia spongiae]UNY97536.1 tetratricopeptide repeat protein [Zhouia spongiae]